MNPMQLVMAIENEAIEYGLTTARQVAKASLEKDGREVSEEEVQNAAKFFAAAYKAGADNTLHKVATLFRTGAFTTEENLN